MSLFNYFSWKDVLPGLNPFFILFQFFFLKWYFIKIFCWITCTFLENAKYRWKKKKQMIFSISLIVSCILFLLQIPLPLAVEITEGRNGLFWSLSPHDTPKQDNCEFWKSSQVFKMDFLSLRMMDDVSVPSVNTSLNLQPLIGASQNKPKFCSHYEVLISVLWEKIWGVWMWRELWDFNA